MKTEQVLVVKCTLGELMGSEPHSIEKGVSATERDITNAFNGADTSEFLTGNRNRFEAVAKSQWKDLGQICFAHSELFLRFSRIQLEHQGSFFEEICTILWKNDGDAVLEIEVQWSASKKRTIQVQKMKYDGVMGKYYMLRFTLI